MEYLRQNTAVIIITPPMLDSTDGNTPETGLTISQADIRLSKNGSAYAQTNNIAGATHMEYGKYSIPLNTTDTNTLGRLRIDIHESGALAVWREFMVVTVNAYDSKVSTDVLQVDLRQIEGTLQSATDLRDFTDIGYDPATHKVQGVTLVDTTSINTDMVGTNGANTTTPPTVIEIREEMDSNSVDLNAILSDTSELQTNQGNWATATGFATQNPPSLILDDYKADVTNLDATISSRSPTNEYDTEMGRIDVNVSSRNAIAPNVIVPDVAGTAATLHGITDTLLTTIGGIVDDIKFKTDNLPSGITKNEALPRFDFLMVLSSDHITAATGKVVIGEISKDGGAFTGITNTIIEVSSGMYTIASGLTQTEMNADVITLKFDEFECDTRIITLLTT